MEKVKTKEIGDWGEQLAEEFLRNLGYRILEKNWRTGKSEIDIIATLENTLVFVEVKTRKNAWFGNPEDFVTQQKANRIKNASEEYQILNRYEGFIRFDIIGITGKKSEYEILHFLDAF